MPLPEPGNWPEGVEWRPRRQSFAQALHAQVRATKMEAGNTHREALDSDEVVTLTVLWRFTPAEWTETMEPFFLSVRATGWQGLWVNAAGTIRQGLITVDGEAPKASPRGALIDVTATIEIVPDAEPVEP